MIAIDFGLKRIGIAWKCGELVLPLEAIFFESVAQCAGELSKIIAEKAPKTLVVGIVREEIRGVLDEILAALNFGGEVVFIDENLSSIEAESHIQGRKRSKKLRKDGTLDSLAAMVILQRYLQP